MPELRKQKFKTRPKKVIQFQVVGSQLVVLDEDGDIFADNLNQVFSTSGSWRTLVRSSPLSPEEMTDLEFMKFIEVTDSVRRRRKRV